MKYGNILSCIIGFLLGFAVVITYKLALVTNGDSLPSLAVPRHYVLPSLDKGTTIAEPDVVSVNLTEIVKVDAVLVNIGLNKSHLENPLQIAPNITKTVIKPQPRTTITAVSKDLRIALDFMTSDSAMFTLPNYRSFETMLTLYPDNKFNILIPAPPLTGTYKYGNMFSPHQFDKYIKRGYLITYTIFNPTQYSFKSDPGSKYWSGNHPLSKSLLKQLRQTVSDRAGDKRMTYFDATFFRMRQLYEHGGISTDFSLAFVSPVSVTNIGIWHRQHCFLTGHDLPANKSIADTITADLKVRGSPSGNSFIPLFSPSWPPADLTHPYEAPIRNVPVCAYSFIFATPKRNHPVVSCVLSAYDDDEEMNGYWYDLTNTTFLSCVERDQLYDGGFHCVDMLLDSCLKHHKVRNEFEKLSIEDFGFDFHTAGQLLYYSPLDVVSSATSLHGWDRGRSDHQFNEYGSILSKSTTINAFWIGPSAHIYDWSDPHPESVIGRVFDNINLVKWHPFHLNSSCNPTCHHVKATKSQGDSEYGAHQCALHFVIPGIMKAATSFAFSAIAKHPQIVNPVKGFQFKETGAYMDRFVASVPFKTRFGYFPFLEPRDGGIVTGDGTVFYAVQEKDLTRLVSDNPDLKAVLVVRNPAIRSYSHWRYLWNSIGKVNGTNFNSNSVSVLSEDDGLGELRQFIESGDFEGEVKLIVNNNSLIGGLKQYLYGKIPNDHSAYLKWSIYIYPYLLLTKKLGRDNVMVISSEELSPFDDRYRLPEHRLQSDTLGDVIKFLGLCEMKFSEEIKPKYVNADTHFPADQKMTKETYEAFAAAFRPFNEALYKAIGRDLLWEKQLFK